MKAKIFLFVRDDEYLLSTWIPYHAQIVGMDNLYLIDHLSSENGRRFYEQYIPLGLNVRVVNCSFRAKGTELSKWMNEVKHEADLLIPLDSDEFIVAKAGEVAPICEPAVIKQSLDALSSLVAKHSFFIMLAFCDAFNFDDPLVQMTDFTGPFYPEPMMGSKTFFGSKYFISTDEGNHSGQTTTDNNKWVPNDLGLLHFSHRGFYHFASKCIRGRNVEKFDEKFVPISGEWRAGWNGLLDGSLRRNYEAKRPRPNFPRRTGFATKVGKLRQTESEAGRYVVRAEEWLLTKQFVDNMKNDPTLKPAIMEPPKRGHH